METLLMFQCPSCIDTPSCSDCAGVIAAGVFWIAVFIAIPIIWRLTDKQKRR